MTEERIDDTGFGSLRIIQRPDEFCYGVDAVLLADFTKVGPGGSVIDLGTGNGIVPLILSHKTEAAKIAGLEVREGPFSLACRNAEMNGLNERVEFINCDVKDVKAYLPGGSFDAVVSNPPYMACGTGIKNAGDAKTAARHETTADLSDFVGAANYLLKDRGDFYMVHRPHRLTDIMALCREYRLEPKEMLMVSARKGGIPNILLLHCRKYGGRDLKLLEPLYVYNDDGTYSDRIMKIYERNEPELYRHPKFEKVAQSSTSDKESQ